MIFRFFEIEHLELAREEGAYFYDSGIKAGIGIDSDTAKYKKKLTN